MMLRVAISFLLIATVLICPYLCLGEEAEAVGVCSAVTACRCCDRPVGSNNDAPKSPEDDEPDCLCHGAIQANKVDSSDFGIGQLSPHWFWTVDLGLSLPVFARVAPDAFHPVHFPPTSSGSEICALINARLL